MTLDVSPSLLADARRMDSHADDTVTHWLRGLKAGDQEAARKLWERYFGQMQRVARKFWGNARRRVADEEDVALSVFNALCQGAADGRFDRLESRDDLWRLLVSITHRKTAEHLRDQGRQKRGGGRVRGDSIFGDQAEGGERQSLESFPIQEPTPEFVASMNEECQRLLDQLGSESLRQVALWRLEGHTNDEIADLLGMTTRSIERKLRVIRDTWSKELNV